jgi:hypothetical protein
MKKTFYFSHDYNARSDPKLIKLRAKYGMEGIGVYWCLIEMLYEQGGEIKTEDIETIAFELRIQHELLNSIIKDFNLFKINSKNFYSASVKNRLTTQKNITKKRKEAALRRWKSINKDDANAMQMQCNSNTNAMQMQCNSNAIKRKESKVKESKVNKVNKVSNKHKETKYKHKEDISPPSSEIYVPDPPNFQKISFDKPETPKEIPKTSEKEKEKVPRKEKESFSAPKPDTSAHKKARLFEIDIGKYPYLEREHIEIAKAFQVLIRNNLEEAGASTKTVDTAKGTWVDDIRLIFSDGYNAGDLREVYRFLQHSQFWKKNILSTSSLRKHMDKLKMEIKNGKSNTNSGFTSAEEREETLRAIARGIARGMEERNNALQRQTG